MDVVAGALIAASIAAIAVARSSRKSLAAGLRETIPFMALFAMGVFGARWVDAAVFGGSGSIAFLGVFMMIAIVIWSAIRR